MGKRKPPVEDLRSRLQARPGGRVIEIVGQQHAPVDFRAKLSKDSDAGGNPSGQQRATHTADLRAKLSKDRNAGGNPSGQQRATLTAKDLRETLLKKESGDRAPKGSSSKSVTDRRPTDWDCSACGALVFGTKDACFACGTPRGQTRGAATGGNGGKLPRATYFHKMKHESKTAAEVAKCLAAIEPPLRDAKEFSVALNAYGKLMEWRGVLELVHEMRERRIAPDVPFYNGAISMLGRAQRWEEALRLLDDLVAEGLQPDVKTFSSAISACEKGAQADRALELLDEMERAGLRPDVVAFSAAISACEKGKQWE